MKEKVKFRYLDGDRSIRIVPSQPTPRHVGSLTMIEKSTKWKKASKKTMQELFEKGVLNQSQIDRMEDGGFNFAEAAIKRKLEGLNIDNPTDFVKFVQMSKENPDVLKVMSKIMATKEKQAAQNKAVELERQLRSLDLTSIEGFKKYAELVKAEPEAAQVFEKIMANK